MGIWRNVALRQARIAADALEVIHHRIGAFIGDQQRTARWFHVHRRDPYGEASIRSPQYTRQQRMDCLGWKGASS